MKRIRPDIDYLRRYVNGELSPREMFAVERAAHEDQLLADIISGLETERDQNLPSYDHSKIKERVAKGTSKYKRLNWWYFSAVASVVLMLGVVGYFLITSPITQTDYAGVENSTESISRYVDVSTDSVETTEIDSFDNRIAFEHVSPHVARPRDRDERPLEHIKLPPLAAAPQGLLAERTPTNEEDTSFSERLTASTARIDQGTTAMRRKSSIVSRSADHAGNSDAARYVDRQYVSISPNQQNQKDDTTVLARIGNLPVRDIKSISSGIVLDNESRNPLSDVSIRDVHTNNVVRTDSTGRFVIASALEETELMASLTGYETRKIAADGSLVITLKPANVAMEEVTVATKSSRSRTAKSMPEQGWQDFRRYLYDEVQRLGLGKATVKVVFSVSAAGRPINVRVKSSAGAIHDREAIRILAEGPDWTPGKDAKAVELTVRF